MSAARFWYRCDPRGGSQRYQSADRSARNEPACVRGGRHTPPHPARFPSAPASEGGLLVRCCCDICCLGRRLGLGERPPPQPSAGQALGEDLAHSGARSSRSGCRRCRSPRPPTLSPATRDCAAGVGPRCAQSSSDRSRAGRRGRSHVRWAVAARPGAQEVRSCVRRAAGWSSAARRKPGSRAAAPMALAMGRV